MVINDLITEKVCNLNYLRYKASDKIINEVMSIYFENKMRRDTLLRLHGIGCE
jgi:hypothetical protein